MLFFEPGKRYVMGILNLTPDSFYDGGKYQEIFYALERVEEMIEEGVAIIDIGAESSRPGSEGITIEEEKKRLLPILNEIEKKYQKLSVPISIDTYKPEIAREVLNLGIDIINDVYGLRNEGMAETIAEYNAWVIIMHMKGNPKEMQDQPYYEEVVSEVRDFFKERIDFALNKGIKENKIIIDPGIGFGKRLIDNIQLIKACKEFKELGFPVLIGASRKSMVGALLDNKVDDRKNGSVITHTLAFQYGADIIRTHDVTESVEIVKILSEFDK